MKSSIVRENSGQLELVLDKALPTQDDQKLQNKLIRKNQRKVKLKQLV